MNSSIRKIRVGTASCGIAAGAEAVLQALRSAAPQLAVEETGCIGHCYAEPLVEAILDDGSSVFYSQAKGDAGSIENILTLGADNRFEIPAGRKSREMIKVLALAGRVNPVSCDDYIAHGGYEGLKKALAMPPEKVVDEVKLSGLRGRGGGGFPTGMKWSFLAAKQTPEKILICNADEGDPGAYMDRSVMESNPHQMLEGMVIGGYAVGANHGFIYVRAEYPLAIERLKTAIKQAEKKGMLGRNIGGTTFSFDIELRYGAGAFVTGEETALIASVEGQRGLPRPRPPYPAERGLWGKPTLINNVETFANIPPIIRNGGDWFASIGTEKSKGTKVLSLVGRINSVGLIEVPLGITLREIIYDLGGGIPEGRKFKAVQTGGPSGGCIPEEHLDLPVDYESLMQAGSIMGSGGMIVMDETSCMVDVAKYFMDFCKSEACGKCIPCRVGTVQMHHILEKITNGTATTADLPMLEELCDLAKHASLCGLGQSAPNPVLSTLRYFRDEYITHIEERRCPAGVCKFKDAGSFREAVEVKR